MTSDKLKELRKIAEKATPAVMGYPFDMDFAKEAMNSFIPLLDQLAEANEKLAKAREALQKYSCDTSPKQTSVGVEWVHSPLCKKCQCLKEISDEGAG